MSEILARHLGVIERLPWRNNLRFESVSRSCDGQECPSYRPSPDAQHFRATRLQRSGILPYAVHANHGLYRNSSGFHKDHRNKACFMTFSRTNLFWIFGIMVMTAFGSCSEAKADEFRVFVGTYSKGDSISKGIYTCLFDSETGKLTEPELAIELANPSFLAVHPTQEFLYAVNELSEGPGKGNGGVTAMKINPDGTLMKLNDQPSFGGAPCHCNVDVTGRTLLIANYTGGNVVAYPIAADGKIGEASSNIHHEDPTRENAAELKPRAHSINLSSDNRFAYAADLGLDKIFIYKLDAENSTLSPSDPPSASVTLGGGPRHFAIHPSGNFAYTNNETSLVQPRLHAMRRPGHSRRSRISPRFPAAMKAKRALQNACVIRAANFYTSAIAVRIRSPSIRSIRKQVC